MARIFDHVDLRVVDLATAGRFYLALLPALGFTVRVSIDGWLQFEAAADGPAEFFGITQDVNHVPNASRIAFWAVSKQQVDALSVMLAPAGALNIEGPGFESDDYYAVYFNDPSGNRLEICHRSKRFKDA